MSYVLTVLATLAYVGIGAALAAYIAIDMFSAGLVLIFWLPLSPLLLLIAIGKFSGERGERRYRKNREQQEAAEETARRARVGQEYLDSSEGYGS